MWAVFGLLVFAPLAGAVGWGELRQGDAGYVEAITTTNRFCPVRCPERVIQPTTTAGLADWMRRGTGPITVKGGGHSYACQSVALEGHTLLDMSRMRERELFHTEGDVPMLRVGAGLRFIDVYPWLQEQGYSMPHGECSTVGMAGWVLNLGNHPELNNFKRHYGDRDFLKRVRGVTPAGSIVEIDAEGVHFLDTSPTEPRWRAKLAMRAAVALFKWIPHIPFIDGAAFERRFGTRSALDIVRFFGTNLLVATELTIELLPMREPAFGYASVSLDRLLAVPGRLHALSHIDEAFEDIDCGIILNTNARPGEDVTASLKCVDWAAPQGDMSGLDAMLASAWPETAFYQTGSSALVWHTGAIGMGWVPRTYVFPKALGPKVTAALGGVLHTLHNTSRQCSECFVELNHWENKAMTHLDWFCSDRPVHKATCSAWVEGIHQRILAIIGTYAVDPHLPNCGGGVAEHYPSALVRGVAARLSRAWDPHRRIDYWMAPNHAENGMSCEAGRPTAPQDPSCRVTVEETVEVEQRRYAALCPVYDRPWLQTVHDC